MKKLILFFIVLCTSLQATYIKTDCIVTDTQTGLMWQDDYTDNNGNVKKTNWYNALSYCNDLDAFGYDDWRLPNVNELASITDITKGTEPDTIGDVRAISDVFNLTFFSTFEDVPWFWSSTTHATNITVGWGVCFLDGHISPHDKVETHRYVRCVRDQGGNIPPVANAGLDQNSVTGTLVTLDGSGSSDADNDPLTYSWSFTSLPAGSTAILTNPSAIDPAFTPDVDGEYVIQLIVNDGTVDSAPSSVTVTASPTPPENTPPIADAGPDKTVQVNNTVTISGSGNDSDGSIVAYRWVKQSTGQILASTPTFDFTPTGTKTKTLVLTVTDNEGATASDEMILTVTDNPVGNTQPTADAGPDKTVQVNNTVTISGSGNDSDGIIVAYRWVKQSTGQILASTPTFDFTPTGTKTKTLVLTVTDNEGATASDEMILTVTAN